MQLDSKSSVFLQIHFISFKILTTELPNFKLILLKTLQVFKVSKSRKQFMVSSILPKNKQKQCDLRYHTVVKSIFFVCFLGELRRQSIAFKIYWPLEVKNCFLWFWSVQQFVSCKILNCWTEFLEGLSCMAINKSIGHWFFLWISLFFFQSPHSLCIYSSPYAFSCTIQVQLYFKFFFQ